MLGVFVTLGICLYSEIIMFLYLKVDEDRPVIKPEQTIRNIVLNIPKIPEPKKEEKKEERVEKQVEDKKTNIPIPELKAKAKEKKIEIFEENQKYPDNMDIEGEYYATHDPIKLEIQREKESKLNVL